MRDHWVWRIASLLLGGLSGIYSPELIRWFVPGLFLLLFFWAILWRPRDFLGSTWRPELLVLISGGLIGFIYGVHADSAVEKPLVINRTVIVGELLDWSITEEGARGSVRILEPPEMPEESQASLQKSQAGSEKSQTLSAQGKEPDYIKKKYTLRVYPVSDGKLPEGWDLVRPGDVLRFSAKLEHPKPPGTPGQFDLPLYNAVRGIAGGLTAQGAAEIISPGEPPLSWGLKERVQKVLEHIPGTQNGVLQGILFGDTSQIPEDDLERYRVTGVYHVFSASGSNVAFLLILCWGAFRLLALPLRIGLSIGVLVFYAILCGGAPPILRATIMGGFILLGRLHPGKVSSLRLLFGAGLGLFIWQPLILKDIGFQLSFMAAWGILVLSPKLTKFSWIKRWPGGLKQAIAMTAAAQIATLPLLISTFHRLSLISLLANLLVLFFLGAAFELGVIGVIFSFFLPLALPLFQVSLWLLGLANKLLFQLAGIPWADAWAVNPGALFWLCWYGWIIVMLLGRERVRFWVQVRLGNWRRKLNPWWTLWRSSGPVSWLRSCLGPARDKLRKTVQGASVIPPGREDQRNDHRASLKPWITGERILAAVVIAILLWSPWNTPYVLEVTFIDVGQGDSILIETPQGSRILVDTGPKTERFDAGAQIIIPFLLEEGIKHLDGILLTHAHADHVGGASAILETIPVDWVGIPEDGQDWLTIASGNDDRSLSGNPWGEVDGLEPGLIKQLAAKRLEKLSQGDRLMLDSGNVIEVLAPGEPLSGTNSDENNNSLVLRLKTSTGQNVLLTGDMEKEEMAEILSSGQDFSADLFKVPHHGSRTSLVPDWLDRIAPKAVVIPVGKNTFGHPTPEVLQYWEERHIPVYRTDEDGTVRVRLDESGIEVITGRRAGQKK